MSINFALRKYINSVFIETGTYLGDGVRRTLEAGFKKIYSIELNEKFYKNLLVIFEREIKAGRVELLLGDSATCLTDILKHINHRATFWLDAHYSSGDTARGLEDVPLLKELNVISKYPIKTHTILIDDIRLFGTNYIVDWSNIQLVSVIEKLKKINRYYTIFYENGVCKKDILVAEVRRFSWFKIMGKIEEIVNLQIKFSKKITKFLGLYDFLKKMKKIATSWVAGDLAGVSRGVSRG